MKNRLYASLLLGATSSLALTTPAFAQNADQQATAPEEEAREDDEEGKNAIIVQGTRLGRRLQDEPIRVEVIAGEEIEEKAIMRPGNIAMLVNETGGVRVQVTSPALGAANIRIQGLEGRYTQLLADNLPLYGGQAASLGLLQIPPTDLAQVEVIKGSASALYGASALGGVINLISKRPGDEFEAEMLANATTRNGQDLTAYVACPITSNAGLSLTAGAHRQTGQYRGGSLLHRPPGPRRQPLPNPIAALFASRNSWRDHPRECKPVRQRGEPSRCASDEIRSAATAATRRKRAVDRRCLGTSRRIYPERRHKATLRRTLICSTPLALRA